MKKITIIVLLAAVICGTLIFARSSTNCSQPVRTNELSTKSLIERGKYLVAAAGCGDCHSPKVMTAEGPQVDSTKLFSGYRSDAKLPGFNQQEIKKGWTLLNSESTSMVSEAGIAYAANITPDETGIGEWTFEQFKTAVTKGKWKGLENGRPLLPPMPWQNYARLDDCDLEAIFTYLQSIKPVKNVVPAAVFFIAKN